MINPTLFDLYNIKKELQIQLDAEELFEIIKTIQKPKNMLVFGVGNDSILYDQVNKNGTTVFLEDNPEWFSFITKKYPHLKTHLISYNTKLSQWKELLNSPQALHLTLPQEISNISWDVILVDGPSGFDQQTPGRMKSIYMASKLISQKGDVFIHDIHREVERIYAEKFFSSRSFTDTIGHTVLRHYIIE